MKRFGKAPGWCNDSSLGAHMANSNGGAPTTDVASSRSRFEVLPVILPPQPLDATAAGVGLIDVPDPRAWLEAIIDGPSAAIISKDPHGSTQSVNQRARG